MLDEFRSIDLKWNNAYERLGDVRTAQFDEKGRKLVVQVTNDGDIVDLRGVELKLVMVDGIEVEGRNLFFLYRFEELMYANLYNTSLRSWKYKGKPNTEYVLSTNLPSRNGILYDLFFGMYPTRPSSGSNGVGLDNPRIINSGKNGEIEITFRGKSTVSGEVGYQEILDGEYWAKLEQGNESTPWTPAPEDLRFQFDLVNAQKGIYELYFPKLFVDNYTGNTKVFLELTTNEFSITSEPFYINVFDGVR